jgi:hypothetical protein
MRARAGFTLENAGARPYTMTASVSLGCGQRERNLASAIEKIDVTLTTWDLE